MLSNLSRQKHLKNILLTKAPTLGKETDYSSLKKVAVDGHCYQLFLNYKDTMWHCNCDLITYSTCNLIKYACNLYVHSHLSTLFINPNPNLNPRHLMKQTVVHERLCLLRWKRYQTSFSPSLSHHPDRHLYWLLLNCKATGDCSISAQLGFILYIFEIIYY